MSSQRRTNAQRDEVKREIKRLFDLNVRGRNPDEELQLTHPRHDGSRGHWLQEQFGLQADAANAPDFRGFELKDSTHSKTTFGDWSADQYIFFSHDRCALSAEVASKCSKCRLSEMTRQEFLRSFGAPNTAKSGRYSWSGAVFPKIGISNYAGQEMRINSDLSIEITYTFEQDLRTDRFAIISDHFRRGQIRLALWKSASLRKRLENKFSEFGWFKCVREFNNSGPYVGIKFGQPIMYESWIKRVADGTVYLDSGMYEGNSRKYSQWRANNSFWDSLVEEVYP